MFKTVLQASVVIALAFPLSVMASPMEAQYAQRGYDVLVQRGAIIPTSSYSKVLQEAISLISQGNSVEEASRKTGVNILVLQKILRLGTPIPAVDPKTVIQATLPVPELPAIAINSVEAIPTPPELTETKEPTQAIAPKKITRPHKLKPIRAKAKTKAKAKNTKKPKATLVSGPKFAEGYGMGYFNFDEFKEPKTFKYKFRIVEDFFSGRPKQPEGTEDDSEKGLTPSQRALMDIQRRHPEVKGLAASP
jgi:hypothetical protein